MRKSLLLYVLCFASALVGCTTTTSSTKQTGYKIKYGQTFVSYVTPQHKAKNGNRVAFYPEESSIKHPYRIIGKEMVSRYNLIGLERRSHIVDEIMKKLAASMGGDAVINITADGQKVEGTVISFEKVLL